jgi:hypothetical protein
MMSDRSALPVPIASDNPVSTVAQLALFLEDVQKAAGHCDPSTTKLYDRRLQPGEGGELLCDLLKLDVPA